MALACDGEGTLGGPAGDEPKDPTDVAPPGDDDDDGPTGGTGGSCAPDPDLQVVAFTATAGLPPTMVELQVELSKAATAAVQCTSDEDPEEIFFAESTTEATSHTLRIEGLLPLTSFTCTAAPLCPTLSGPAASLTYATPTPPSDLRPLTVVEDPTLGMTGAWTLAPYRLSGFFGTSWLVIWGPTGRARWWWPLPEEVGQWIEVLYHTSDDKIVWGGGFAAEGRPHVFDMWDGDQYVWAPPGWQSEVFHHDGKRLPDGRIMTLETRQNGTGGQAWEGFGIRVHDPVSGYVSFDFDSQSLVDQGLLQVPSVFDDDPYHANWVDEGDTVDGPEVYVSLCFSWQILALDAVTGESRWLLGRDLGWNVVDAIGDPLPEDALPQCQHGLEITGERRFLVYDNGQDRSTSSAAEWVVDPATMTAQRLWTWSEAGWQEDFLGDIDALGNDRVLITAASSFSPNELIEVDLATGQVASRMTFTDGETYRAERYLGCDLFDSVRYCDTLAARYAEVAALLVP